MLFLIIFLTLSPHWKYKLIKFNSKPIQGKIFIIIININYLKYFFYFLLNKILRSNFINKNNLC